MEARITRIQQNFDEISGRIRQAARSAGRSEDAVHLVVVTKAQPVEVLRAVVDAGALILGENYPEETLPKIEAIGHPAGVSWHMIGHLQSRKAGIVAAHFDMLESLDSLSLAEKLERQLAPADRVLPVLLELNVSGEAGKNGWPAWQEGQVGDLSRDIEQLLALPHLAVRGLMTMPPLYADPEQTRPFFARLRQLGERLGERFGAEKFCEFSMGTSADFEAAVQEGATFVRVGTAIVGPRPKKS